MTSVRIYSEFIQNFPLEQRPTFSVTNSDYSVDVESAPAPPYGTVKIKRSGQRPLVFDGMLLLEAKTCLGTDPSTFLKLSLWETSAQGYIAKIEMRYSPNLNMSYHEAFASNTAKDCVIQLKNFDPMKRFVFDRRLLSEKDPKKIKDIYNSHQRVMAHRQKAYHACLGMLLEQEKEYIVS